jgi:hypothetical protein
LKNLGDILMKKITIAFVALAALVISTPALAHEGHGHNVMGKVLAVDDSQVEIESKDGKKVTVLFSDHTEFLRGKIIVARSEIKTGDRIVANYKLSSQDKIATKIMLSDMKKQKSTGKDGNQHGH